MNSKYLKRKIASCIHNKLVENIIKKVIPNSLLNEWTKCRRIIFEPYAGNEDSLVRFQGSIKQACLPSKGIAAHSNRRQKDAYRGA